MQVRRSDVTVKQCSRQSDARYKRWELARRRSCEERVFKWGADSRAEDVGRRRDHVERDVLERGARVIDPVTAAHDETARIERRVREPDARREIVLVDAADHSFAHVRDVGRSVLLNNVARLTVTADGW